MRGLGGSFSCCTSCAWAVAEHGSDGGSGAGFGGEDFKHSSDDGLQQPTVSSQVHAAPVGSFGVRPRGLG